uniref:BTB domain-containing protein n=1 Tax=Elaeophora elaphi TaxID=1147741 RepID=A0A0R3RT81_9BILA
MKRFPRGGNRVESINTALACAHSFYIRGIISKAGVKSLIFNCTDLPFHWHTIKAIIQFIRTGTFQIDSAAMRDMVQCAMFFRIAKLSHLMEAFVCLRSEKGETMLDAYKAVFHDEQMMRCVTYDTQETVCKNMLQYLSTYIDDAVKNERSALALMTSNELYCLLACDAQHIYQDRREYENAACKRFQVIMRWIKCRERNYVLDDSYMRDVQSTTFGKVIMLFSCVHFERMQAETRRKLANYLRSVSFKSTSTLSFDDIM